MFSDDAAEYRLLASIVDKPDTVLAYTEELFTGDRQRLFNSMRKAYLAYGELSSEGVERFYGAPVPPEIEMARGAKPTAVLERLEEFATRRQLSNMINTLTISLASTRPIDRSALSKSLSLNPVVTREDSNIVTGITNFVSDLQRKRGGQYKFVSTGLQFLDHMLGGEWPRQALTIVMGKAGGGKTALVVQSLLNMAQMGIPSLFISLEMPRDRIVSRMVANLSGVDGMRLRNGNITDAEQVAIDDALVRIQEYNQLIHIVDKPGLSIEDIVYQIRLHKEAFGIEAFFVDYLQIVDRPDSDNDVEALGRVAQLMRNVAVDLDISAVALSQQNGMQGLQSVWGSRRIVHIADTVMEIEMDTSSTNDDGRMCRFIFHKNRDGAVGESNTVYRPKFLRFEG